MWFISWQKQETFFYPEHHTSCGAYPAFSSVDVVDPSPAVKQLIHEADHSPLSSAEVADQCSFNRASSVCLIVYTGTSLPFTIVLEE